MSSYETMMREARALYESGRMTEARRAGFVRAVDAAFEAGRLSAREARGLDALLFGGVS